MNNAMTISRARTQAIAAPSSGEAELNAVASGFIETLFVKELLEEMEHRYAQRFAQTAKIPDPPHSFRASAR